MSPLIFCILLSLIFGVTCKSNERTYSEECGINLVLEEMFERRKALLKEETPAKSRPQHSLTPSEIHPWVVSYGTVDDKDEWKHGCGGSIISPHFVLTTFSCTGLVGRDGLIRAGDSDLNTSSEDSSTVQMVKVTKVFRHPFRDEKSSSAYYDVAVLQVDPPLLFTDSVRHICLPKQPKFGSDSREAEAITVAGYGETLAGNFSSGTLLSVKVTVRPEEFCRIIYESKQVNEAREALSKDSFTDDPLADITAVQPDENNFTIKATETRTAEDDVTTITSDMTTTEDSDTEVSENEGEDIEHANISVTEETTTTGNQLLAETPRKVIDQVDDYEDNFIGPKPVLVIKTRSNRQVNTYHKWVVNAARMISKNFNSSVLCIGSELGGTGACDGDNGGPGYIFDTSDGYKRVKYTQVALFHGAVACGLAEYPEIYVNLEQADILDFVKEFATGGKEEILAIQ